MLSLSYCVVRCITWPALRCKVYCLYSVIPFLAESLFSDGVGAVVFGTRSI